jgi:hypothetical protein
MSNGHLNDLKRLYKLEQDLRNAENRLLKLEEILDGGVSLGMFNPTQNKVITLTLSGNPSTLVFSS